MDGMNPRTFYVCIKDFSGAFGHDQTKVWYTTVDRITEIVSGLTESHEVKVQPLHPELSVDAKYMHRELSIDEANLCATEQKFRQKDIVEKLNRQWREEDAKNLQSYLESHGMGSLPSLLAGYGAQHDPSEQINLFSNNSKIAPTGEA